MIRPLDGLLTLAREMDHELLTLSDEQYHALWVEEWVAADPTLEPLMALIAKTLEAAGLLDAGSELTGPAALVRTLHDRAGHAVVFRHADGLRARCLVRIGADAVLEQVQERGINTFTLRQVRRALADMVQDWLVVGQDRSVTTQESDAGSISDLDALVLDSEGFFTAEVTSYPVPEWLVTAPDIQTASVMAGTGPDGTSWCAVRGQDGVDVRRPAERAEVLRRLQQLLVATSPPDLGDLTENGTSANVPGHSAPPITEPPR